MFEENVAERGELDLDAAVALRDPVIPMDEVYRGTPMVDPRSSALIEAVSAAA